MNQRSSLYWLLSTLSPVETANEKSSPVAGPVVTALRACIIESPTCMDIASWGRYALV